jgi:proteasome activator subunit 4
MSHVQVYDLRLRALPALYKALQPGTDDDRMKGALWTLNISSFGEPYFLKVIEFI